MKAAVMTKFKSPLEVQELPDPKPGPNDALIKTQACGICRSDWHLWQGDWTWIGIQLNLPLVMGHELSGVVEEVGANVQNFKVDDRVTMPFHMGCGKCEYCYTGRSNLCFANGFVGVNFNGGYGQLVVVPTADVNLVHLPDQVDFLSASALGCRFMTSYHGIVDKAMVQPGESVAVFGAGGIGLSAIQIASALGARVIAVDVVDEKLEWAKREGADATINASNTDVPQAVKELTKGGADVSIDALGSSDTVIAAISSLRKGGRHLQIGLTTAADKGMISLPVDAMVMQEIQFIGSLGCATTSYPGLLSMVSTGKLAPKRLVGDQVPATGVNDVLESMTSFGTNGFNVITSW
jgi:D-arabinose 1-dehydrogenase-like Zn-dependent alcohol dehydrogenase